MSPTRLAWEPLRAKTRTAASSSSRRFSSCAVVRLGTPPKSSSWSLGLRLAGAPGQRLAEAAQRLGDLARDDPDLVRLALRDLRQHLQVLVGEQLRVGITLVDRLEDLTDRLGLALGLELQRLPLPLGLQDRALLLALRGEDLRLLDALGGEDRSALVAVGAHLLLHRVLDRPGRVDRLDLDAVDPDPPLPGRLVEDAAQLAVDLVA